VSIISIIHDASLLELVHPGVLPYTETVSVFTTSIICQRMLAATNNVVGEIVS